jgi:hypothetical protein
MGVGTVDGAEGGDTTGRGKDGATAVATGAVLLGLMRRALLSTIGKRLFACCNSCDNAPVPLAVASVATTCFRFVALVACVTAICRDLVDLSRWAGVNNGSPCGTLLCSKAKLTLSSFNTPHGAVVDACSHVALDGNAAGRSAYGLTTFAGLIAATLVPERSS